MSDKVFLGQRVSKLDIGEKPSKITRVNLLVDSDHMYTAGNDTGRTIEKTCPWGTQAMCNSILASVSAVNYQPFSGESGLIDPAAETGDGITVGGVYSVLADSTIRFNGLYSANISAPGGSEVEDEYPYKSRARRQDERKLAQVYSRITKTADKITLEVNNQVSGLNSKIEQTASSLTTQINNVNSGLTSKIEQTASSLQSQITSANGEISTITQDLDSITTEISYMDRDISKIEQRVNNIRLEVSNGESSSWIDLTVDGITVSSQQVKFTGDVVFESDLLNGYTTISGDCIRTGEISAEYIRLGGELTVYESLDSQYIGGKMGYINSTDFNGNYTSGMGLLDWDGRHQVVVTDGGARLTSPHSEIVAAGSVTVTTENVINFFSDGFNSDQDLHVTSDRTMKEDIRYDVSEKYLPIFENLKPCSFLRKGKGPQRHLGFIAQEYMEAEKAAGISSEDSVIVGESEGIFGLTYSEMIPILVAKIKQLEKRIEEVKSWVMI